MDDLLEQIEEWWDLFTARLSLRWHWLARCYAYRGLRSSGYSRRDSFSLARGMRLRHPR